MYGKYNLKNVHIALLTKEDDEPGTETLSISADPREDGLVKAKTGDDTTDEVYQKWYEAVYTPAASTTTTSGDSSSSTTPQG